VTAMGKGLSPSNGSLSPPPTVKHNGQESGGTLCNIFKFWSFLQSKSVNNVCQLLQFLGDLKFMSMPDVAPRPIGGLLSPHSLGYSLPNESSWCRHWEYCFNVYMLMADTFIKADFMSDKRFRHFSECQTQLSLSLQFIKSHALWMLCYITESKKSSKIDWAVDGKKCNDAVGLANSQWCVIRFRNYIQRRI